jgi:hypothetical protein
MRGEEDDDAVDADHCSARLHCARPAASTVANQPCDVLGVVGCCCAHGIPVLGLFADLPTPEQWAFYLLMLERLVMQQSNLDVSVAACASSSHLSAISLLLTPHTQVYIDFGCRLKGTWGRFAAAHGIDCDEMRIMVNWMHGAAHEVTCQLQNSGRYTKDAGWVVGEQAEQLWSHLKVRACTLCYDSVTLCSPCPLCRTRAGTCATCVTPCGRTCCSQVLQTLPQPRLQVLSRLSSGIGQP